MNERVSPIALDLAANAPNIDINDVGRGIVVQIPDLLQKHRAGHDVTLVADQILKDLEFARQQLDELAATICRPGHEVQFQISDAQYRFLDGDGAAARESFDARQELRESERLNKIVVAASAKASHTFVDLAKSADDQSRR
jgi:hypothetical protein